MFRSFSAVLFIAVFSFSFAFAQTDPAPASPAPSPSPTAEPPTDRITTSPAYTPPTAKARFKRYVNSTVGPFTLARNVAQAGFATATNSPEEWGGQWEGFGKRVASNFGKNLIKQTTIYGLDTALKLDSGYYRATGKSTGAKIRNALISGFIFAWLRERTGSLVMPVLAHGAWDFFLFLPRLCLPKSGVSKSFSQLRLLIQSNRRTASSLLQK